MANVKISSFGNMTTPLTGAELVTGLKTGANKNATTQDIANLANSPFVYVGSTPRCSYPSIPDAITAGETNLYVITDIAVTSDCTFSGNLEIRVANDVEITFTDASIIAATGVEASIVFNLDGACSWIFDSFTSDRTVINLDNSAPSLPSGVSGQLFIFNNSSATFNIKPVSNRIGSASLFYMERVLYLPPLNAGSYFDLENANIGLLIIIGSGTAGQIALKVASGGVIQQVILAGSFDASEYVIDGQNALTIKSIFNSTPTATAHIYAKNSNIFNVSGQDTHIHIESDGYQMASLNNSSAVIYYPLGTGANVAINNCSVAGFNDTGLVSGRAQINNCYFPTYPTFSAVNGDVDYNISNSQATTGWQSTLSFMKFNNCTAGNLSTAGTTATFVIGASSDSVQISNCLSDDTIIDNGTNSSYSYKIF